MEIYRVGGAVRDRLLGKMVGEKDYVVVGGSSELLLSRGFKAVGKDFPVFLHPDTHEEYALARTERSKGRGYKQFTVHAAPDVTLEEDLKRRDLTINAIAETQEGKIVDPYGGCDDLKKKILRHVSPAFVEDPVRVLRVARFMARFADLGFKVAAETMKLMQVMVDNKEIDSLVPERIWREFKRALAEPRPEEFVNTLMRCGAWLRICPGWAQLPSGNTALALDTLKRTVLLTADTTIRFASFMKFIARDTGDVKAVEAISTRWRLPIAYRDLLKLSVCYVHQIHKVSINMPAEECLDLLQKVDALRRKDRFQHLLIVCEADYQTIKQTNTAYTQGNCLLSALRLIQAADLRALHVSGVKGIAFNQALRDLRIQVLKKAGFS